MENTLRTRLIQAMEAKGINAAELSRLSGVGKPNISAYLNEKYSGKQDKVYLLARALEVDPGWLMTGDEPARLELTETERAIIIAYRKAKPGTQEAVRDVLHVEEEKTPVQESLMG